MTTQDLESYFDRLWPICRSITGNGVRESLSILNEIVPIEYHEFKSGCQIFDWQVPAEWNVTDAYILTPSGQKIADFRLNNLSLVNYSEPVNRIVNWEELNAHLHYREDIPDAVPYITSYYKRNWGFCITFNQWKELPREGNYKVVIDSSFNHGGSLTIGESVLSGTSDLEVLVSTYLCHPSMANNELSGPLTLMLLYDKLRKWKDRKLTYRFAFTTETIGTLCFLSLRGELLKKRMLTGYVVTCCGDRGSFTYKRTRSGSELTDYMIEKTMNLYEEERDVREFVPWGSDERQYCSPGFNLPVGTFMRTPYQEYLEYHTSLDNKSFISFRSIEESAELLFQTCRNLEKEPLYVNTLPFGEPRLGSRNLYETLNSGTHQSEALKLRLRLLNYCDGRKSLVQFSEEFGVAMDLIMKEVSLLENAGLLNPLF